MCTPALLVFAVLIACSALIGFDAFHQKNLLMREFGVIQEPLETESMLKEVEMATFHVVMALFSNRDRLGGGRRYPRARGVSFDRSCLQ